MGPFLYCGRGASHCTEILVAVKAVVVILNGGPEGAIKMII